MIAILLNSCKNHELKNVVPCNISVPVKIVNDIDYSFIKGVRYIFLDNKEPIGSIDKILFSNSNFFVLDKLSDKINIYDYSGSLVLSISKKGKGVGESHEITDFVYFEMENQIGVLDNQLGKMLYYSASNGEFQEAYKTELIPTSIQNDVRNVYFFHSMDLYRKDQYRYALITLSKDLDIIKRYFSTDNNIGNINYFTQGLFHCNNTVYFNNKFDNSIYILNKGGIESKIEIDFANNDGFQNYIENNLDISSKNLLQSSFSFDIKDICISEKYVCFSFVQNAKKHNVVYNMKLRKTVFCSDKKDIWNSNLAERGIQILSYPHYVYDNEFIAVLEPQYIKFFYNLNNKKLFENRNDEIIRKFLAMDILDNPVLAFYEYY
jgi:hypothetical protein